MSIRRKTLLATSRSNSNDDLGEPENRFTQVLPWIQKAVDESVTIYSGTPLEQLPSDSPLKEICDNIEQFVEQNLKNSSPMKQGFIKEAQHIEHLIYGFLKILTLNLPLEVSTALQHFMECQKPDPNRKLSTSGSLNFNSLRESFTRQPFQTLLLIQKAKIEEAVWWYGLLHEQTYIINAREEALKNRETNIRVKEQKLQGELMAFAKLNEQQQQFAQPQLRPDHSSSFLTMRYSVDDFSLERKILISVGLPLNDVIKTVEVKDVETCDELISRLFEKYYTKKLPNMKDIDFSLKVPGVLEYVNGSTIFCKHQYVYHKLKSRKLELLLVEKLDSTEMRDIPSIVVKAEQKASVGPLPDDFKYSGPVKDQLEAYEKCGRQLLASMKLIGRYSQIDLIIECGVDPSAIKELFQDHEKRLSNLKQMLKENNFTNVVRMLNSVESIVESTFDQYEGLRQIADFRALPDCGETIVQEGQLINSLFRKLFSTAIIALVEKIIKSKSKDNLTHYVDKFSTISTNLQLEYYSLKSGLLRQNGMTSSLRERVGNLNLNCEFARQFMQEVLQTTIVYIRDQRKLFEAQVREVLKFSEEAQKKIYTKFHGPIQFDMQVEKQFSAIKPWVENWIEVQIISIVQREIFAKDRAGIEATLQENKHRMVYSFKELLHSKIIEPTIKLETLIRELIHEIEQVESGKL